VGGTALIYAVDDLEDETSLDQAPIKPALREAAALLVAVSNGDAIRW
jgi:hypothetical protein